METPDLERFADEARRVMRQAQVEAQRLGHAASLLRNTDRPVEEVAHEVGYENLTFFYRKFREAYGLAPAEYRARHRGHALG